MRESVYGGDGNDTIWAEVDTVYPVYDGGAGTNTINYARNSFAVDGNLYVDLSSFVNVHNVILGDQMATVIGTAGNDTITDANAGGENISIIGGGGNDTININDAGNVTIDASGSGGSNITVTESGDVSVTGGDGNDTINVIEAFNVTVNSGDGNDHIVVAGSYADETDKRSRDCLDQRR